MMKTIDCVECGETVPYGRLSCPACGTLLASVTGGRSRVVRPDDVMPVPDAAPEELASSGVAVATAEREADIPVEPRVAAEVEAEPAPVAAAVATRRTAVPRRATAAKRRLFDPAPIEETPTPWGPLETPEPVLAGRPYQRHVSLEPDPTTWNAALSSAYRPPTLTLSSATAVAGGASAGMAAAIAQPPSMAEPRTSDLGVPRSMVIDAARLTEIAGWFVVVGATMSMLGFLLPWSVTVIGASGIGGYFDSWGMASPTHGFIVLGLLGVLTLGILPTPVAAWLKTGVLGIALGSLIIGLVWPYLVGRLGADVGVTVTALGGLALVTGGVAASWATRNAEATPGV
jgi:hypothetical protein